MGLKRIFQMLSLNARGFLLLAAVFSLRNKSVGGGCARLFRPMYAEANMGHPSRDAGLVLCSNFHAPTDQREQPQKRDCPRPCGGKVGRSETGTFKSGCRLVRAA